MTFNRKDHHMTGEIIPRFKLATDLDEETIFKNLTAFVKEDKTVVGKRILNQFYLDIPSYEGRGFWSPELKITVEKDEYDFPGKTIVRVMVGPQQTVWMLFVFIYSFLGLFSLIGGMYGLTQLNLGNDSLWIWCFPITILVILSVYVVAKIGQGTARDQTLHLVSSLYHAIGFEHLERVDS